MIERINRKFQFVGIAIGEFNEYDGVISNPFLKSPSTSTACRSVGGVLISALVKLNRAVTKDFNFGSSLHSYK